MHNPNLPWHPVESIVQCVRRRKRAEVELYVHVFMHSNLATAATSRVEWSEAMGGGGQQKWPTGRK